MWSTVSFALLSLLLAAICSYGFSSSTIHHSKDPLSLPLHTSSCICTGLDLLIGSISDVSVFPLERKAVCGGDHENVLLRLRLLNTHGSPQYRPHAQPASELGVSLKSQFESLLQEFFPILKLRYRWALIMRGRYWMQYYTVRATVQKVRSGPLPLSDAAADFNQSAEVANGRSRSKRFLGNGTQRSRSGGFGYGGGGFDSSNKGGKRRSTAEMMISDAEDDLGRADKGQNEQTWRQNQANSGSAGSGKAGNFSRRSLNEVGRSGFGDMKSGFGDGESGFGSCLPRGDVLVSHTRGGAGGSAGFEILKAPNALVSHNQRFHMRMQADCDLVLYNASGHTLWRSFTRNKGTHCTLSLLHDGSLVVSSGSLDGTIVWSSDPPPLPSCPSIFFFILQDDGNAIIYNMLSSLPIWATNTKQ